MWDMIVSSEVYQGVMLTSSLLSSDNTQSFQVGKTPGEGISDRCVPFRGSVLRQLRRVQRKPLPAFVIGISNAYSWNNHFLNGIFWGYIFRYPSACIPYAGLMESDLQGFLNQNIYVIWPLFGSSKVHGLVLVSWTPNRNGAAGSSGMFLLS